MLRLPFFKVDACSAVQRLISAARDVEEVGHAGKYSNTAAVSGLGEFSCYVARMALRTVSALILLPLFVSAASSDAVRLCRDNALISRLVAEERAEQNYLRKLDEARERAAQDYQSLLVMSSLDQRKEQRKFIKERFRNSEKFERDQRKASIRSAKDAEKSARERCKSQTGKGIGEVCFSSGECQSDLRCSTERGDCQRVCQNPSDVCILVCSGRCERR